MGCGCSAPVAVDDDAERRRLEELRRLEEERRRQELEEERKRREREMLYARVPPELAMMYLIKQLTAETAQYPSVVSDLSKPSFLFRALSATEQNAWELLRHWQPPALALRHIPDHELQTSTPSVPTTTTAATAKATTTPSFARYFDRGLSLELLPFPLWGLLPDPELLRPAVVKAADALSRAGPSVRAFELQHYLQLVARFASGGTPTAAGSATATSPATGTADYAAMAAQLREFMAWQDQRMEQLGMPHIFDIPPCAPVAAVRSPTAKPVSNPAKSSATEEKSRGDGHGDAESMKTEVEAEEAAPGASLATQIAAACKNRDWDSVYLALPAAATSLIPASAFAAIMDRLGMVESVEHSSTRITTDPPQSAVTAVTASTTAAAISASPQASTATTGATAPAAAAATAAAGTTAIAGTTTGAVIDGVDTLSPAEKSQASGACVLHTFRITSRLLFSRVVSAMVLYVDARGTALGFGFPVALSVTADPPPRALGPTGGSGGGKRFGLLPRVTDVGMAHRRFVYAVPEGEAVVVGAMLPPADAPQLWTECVVRCSNPRFDRALVLPNAAVAAPAGSGVKALFCEGPCEVSVELQYTDSPQHLVYADSAWIEAEGGMPVAAVVAPVADAMFDQLVPLESAPAFSAWVAAAGAACVTPLSRTASADTVIAAAYTLFQHLVATTYLAPKAPSVPSPVHVLLGPDSAGAGTSGTSGGNSGTGSSTGAPNPLLAGRRPANALSLARLYTAGLRHLGIPARLATSWGATLVHFFAPGVGWVPVDAALLQPALFGSAHCVDPLGHLGRPPLVEAGLLLAESEDARARAEDVRRATELFLTMIHELRSPHEAYADLLAPALQARLGPVASSVLASAATVSATAGASAFNTAGAVIRVHPLADRVVAQVERSNGGQSQAHSRSQSQSQSQGQSPQIYQWSLTWHSSLITELQLDILDGPHDAANAFSTTSPYLASSSSFSSSSSLSSSSSSSSSSATTPSTPTEGAAYPPTGVSAWDAEIETHLGWLSRPEAAALATNWPLHQRSPKLLRPRVFYSGGLICMRALPEDDAGSATASASVTASATASAALLGRGSWTMEDVANAPGRVVPMPARMLHCDAAAFEA